MDAIYSMMNFNNNFKNIGICLKSDQEHISEYQISITLIAKDIFSFSILCKIHQHNTEAEYHKEHSGENSMAAWRPS